MTVLTAATPLRRRRRRARRGAGDAGDRPAGPRRTVEAVDALVLAGGSAFGLDAASGVMDGLHAAGRGFAVGGMRVPLVPAAILFDLRERRRQGLGGEPLPPARRRGPGRGRRGLPQALSPPFARSKRIAAGTSGTRTPPASYPRPAARSPSITPDAASSPKAEPPASTSASTASTVRPGASRSVSRVPAPRRARRPGDERRRAVSTVTPDLRRASAGVADDEPGTSVIRSRGPGRSIRCSARRRPRAPPRSSSPPRPRRGRRRRCRCPAASRSGRAGSSRGTSRASPGCPRRGTT